MFLKVYEMNKNIAYDIIANAVKDRYFLQALINNPDETIRRAGLISQEEITELKNIILPFIKVISQYSETSTLLLNQMKTTMETADKFKWALSDTIEQIEEAYKSVMRMYKISFYLGIILIIFSLFFAIFDKASLLPIIFSGMGVADIITFFIAKPPQNLQNSRANLAQLQAAFFNWFIDVYNWNSYLAYLTQINQINFENVKKVSETLLDNTNKTMELIEEYCELKK